MWPSPVSASASMRRTLSATGIIFFSDWKPSRGPSSEMLTRLGKSDMFCSFGATPRSRSALFLEGFLAGFLDAGQGHEHEQDGGGNQQAEADRPLDEHRRIAPRQQHGATEIFLHLWAQDEAEQEWRALAAQP